MKEVTVTVDFEGCRAQAVFDAVFGNGSECLQQFHRQFNHCEPSIPDWENGQRVISFTTPVDAPQMLRRLIGADVIQISESQTLSTTGGAIVMKAVPVPDFPGADKFTTAATTTISDTPRGCTVLAAVACTAAGPFGLTGTIEGFMAATAQKSLAEFWGFCQAFIAQLLASGQLAAVEPAEPAPVPVPVPAATTAAAAALELEAPAGEAEQFHDVFDLGSADLSRMDATSLLLRYLCRTGDQQVAVLQSLDSHLAHLQQLVAAMAAEQRRQAEAASWWPRWRLPDSVSGRQALLMAAVAATSSAAVAILWSERRHRQTNGAFPA